jgi:putative MATE family efflux protein
MYKTWWSVSMQRVDKKQRNKDIILNSPNLYKSIILLALPIFLSNLLKSLHSFIDMYFVSNLLDIEAKSSGINAINLSNSPINITISIAAGLMVAGSALIAQYLGAKMRGDAKKTAGMLLVLSLIFGIILNVGLFFLAPVIAKWFDVSSLTETFMVQYLQIRSFEMVPLFLFFAFQASRQSSGDTVTPVLFNIASFIVNVVFTYIFMKFLRLGVAGSAYATLIAQGIILPFFLVMMFKDKKAEVYLDVRDLNFDTRRILKIFSMAWPIAISQSFTSLGFMILNKLIVGFGEQTVSAFSIGNNINMLILMPVMGIGGVLATFVGQNIGAGNEGRARDSVKKSTILSVSIMLIGMVIIIPFRRALGGIFLSDLPEALELSSQYMMFLFLGLPLMAIYQVFMGAYQGSGETKFSLILSIIRLWFLRIPILLFYDKVLGLHYPDVIWYAMVISNFASMMIGLVLYSFCKFKPKINIEKQLEEINV